MGLLGILGKFKQQQKCERKYEDFELVVDEFNLYYHAVSDIVKPLNNLYWCIDLNLDYSISNIEETRILMSNYLAMIFKFNSSYHSILDYSKRNSDIARIYFNNINEIKNAYMHLSSFIPQVVSRYDELVLRYPSSKQFKIIKNALEESVESLQADSTKVANV